MFAIAMTTAYVAVLYLSKHTRPSMEISRNDPKVVKLRCGLVCLVTIAVWLATTAHQGHPPIGTPADFVFGLGVTASLYAAPLANRIANCDLPELNDIWALRDYVIGPVTEELVFRACLIDTLYNWTYCQTIFISPLYFGVAHVHHMYESWLHSRNFVKCLIPAVFQLGFTSLFGWYASWLYLTTGSVAAPIAAHMFCNFMGLPEWTVQSWVIPYRMFFLAGVSMFGYLVYHFT